MANEHEGREGIEVLDSGAIKVWVEGKVLRLRRPRVREFRALREKAHDIGDEIVEAATVAQERQAEMAMAVAERDSKQTADERAEVRKLGRELSARREELYLSWWADVGATLCGDPGWPELDEMAAWMGEADATSTIITHWRTAPSLSGVR